MDLKVFERAHYSRTLDWPNLGCFEVKVNRVVNLQGDDARMWGTPCNDHKDDQSAAYFHWTIFKKDFITINFENAALKNGNIIADGDIVVDDHKVSGIDRFGLNCEGLKAFWLMRSSTTGW